MLMRTLILLLWYLDPIHEEGPRVPQPMGAGDTLVLGAGRVDPLSDESFYTTRQTTGSGSSSKASQI